MKYIKNTSFIIFFSASLTTAAFIFEGGAARDRRRARGLLVTQVGTLESPVTLPRSLHTHTRYTQPASARTWAQWYQVFLCVE